MLKGIDVSYCQGNIDWKKAAKEIDFAIVKATQGTAITDRYYVKNVTGCHENGVRCGVYHYLTAISTAEAMEQAEYFYKTITPYSDYIDLYAVVDVEDDILPKDKSELTDIVKTFCQCLTARNVKVCIYTNPYFIKYRLNDISEYPLWLAYWGVTEDKAEKYSPVMWQYGTGSVPGIKGDVDVDNGYFDEEVNMSNKQEKVSDWSEDARKKAIAEGIVKGYGDGTYGWQDNLTLERFITIMDRLGLIKEDEQK